MLIDACAQLAHGGIDFSCEIIGDGPLRDELQTRVAQNNLARKVLFSGDQSQDYVLKSLAACDIFVLAALIDARGASDVFPTVIAEAMTSSKPVVSTTVAGIPELVAQNETGLLVPPQDGTALAAAITRLVRDSALRARLGRAGRVRIEKQFTIENAIEPLLQRFPTGNKTATAR